MATPQSLTNVSLDPARFFLLYQVNGTASPNYHVLPKTTGSSPFNTASTPLLLPATVEIFGGQITAALAPAGPAVHWGLDIRLFRLNNTLITSQGFAGTSPVFDHLAGGVTGLLEPGTTGDAGYTVLSTVNHFRDFLFQPRDLGANTPVRMEITVLPFADAQDTQPIPDTDRSNNLLAFWIMRVGG